ncbi:DNA helicase RecQ [Siphonobacter sp. SORGH_AS_1065]|uniref:DNA helicase RecQ n=1 Tax=Siphonobacter sp. SORGH_AS_1065 TaxID=3041795 RepID=UPI002788B361|nr:DNA helicase RecQ [Siphonobacter sp. SORGH_AS_1065]MDQ1086098.1 ATP-dependent DNA helicase RecQ [Siphonobacter sp. SORGH_AS_1065]
MSLMISTKEQVLKQYFGYDQFRPLQADIIDTVLAGKDCLVLMPTGGGKSVCYQVPAMVLDGLTIVISPLIALMQDQVQGLVANGIPAAFLNSTLSNSEQESVIWKVKLGELKLLYVSPERLFAGNFLNWLKEQKISLFAVDESHCISFWGHDFRPEYTQLHRIKESFPEVPIIALTATADKVTRKDILHQLGIPDAPTFLASFDRPNLSLTVLPGRKRLQQIQDFLDEHPNQPGIIYCLSRKSTETVAASLQKEGYQVKYYHAGCDAAYRTQTQAEFLKDDIQIIVATIAFGMGIDKSNVRWIIHYNLPKNVESFYQEIGRAGRDGLPADTVLFYSYQDVAQLTEMIIKSEQSTEQKDLLKAKLDRMKQYAQADICRRRILISYFNETVEKDCGNCDVCRNPRTLIDGTVIAQKALSAIARTDQKIAMGMLIDILRGSHNQNILRHGYDQLKTYGVGRDLKTEEWVEYIGQLLNSGIIDIAYDEGHAFKLNEMSTQVLRGNRPVSLVQFVPFEKRKSQEIEAEEKASKTKREVVRDALFERLRTLRKQIADSLGMPPFVVFSDATLSDMAQKRPLNHAQFLQISGVGEQKDRQFGEVFINEILAFIQENPQAVRTEKGQTYALTLELYKRNLSIEEMAEQRSLAISTIFSHLQKLKAEGETIDLTKFISERTKETILEAARQLGIPIAENAPIGPLLENFGDTYQSWQLRLAFLIAGEGVRMDVEAWREERGLPPRPVKE